jgi:hypothetical protein
MHSHEIHLRSDLKSFRAACGGAVGLGLLCLAAGIHLDTGAILLKSVGGGLVGTGFFHGVMWARRALQLYRFLKSLRPTQPNQAQP